MKFLPSVVFAAALFALALVAGAYAAEPDAGRRVAGWIRTFAVTPVEDAAQFDVPDYHGTLIETAARQAMTQKLVALGYAKAADAGPDAVVFSVSVKAPAPKGRKSLPKSPVQIVGEDPDPYDNFHNQELRAELVDVPKRRNKSGAPELGVTIYARRGDERIWSGYAGAAIEGANREAVARGLVDALLNQFGASANIEEAMIDLPADSEAITIVEPAAE